METYKIEKDDLGNTFWTKNGEPVAHTPEGILNTLLVRTLERAEKDGTLSADVIDHLHSLLDQAWPMISEDIPEQYVLRLQAVEAFRRNNLIA